MLRNGTVAQRASFVFGVFYLSTAISGFLVNPDFGTGSDVTSEFFVVDWNGWHALLDVLAAPLAFISATRPTWAVAFLVLGGMGNTVFALWALVDQTPWGIMSFPNVAADVALHLLTAAVSLLFALVQVRSDRRAAVG